jgi:hypothetical protein
LERACTLSQDGAIGPIFEGDMPPKKMTPKSGAVNSTITGILLKDNPIGRGKLLTCSSPLYAFAL